MRNAQNQKIKFLIAYHNSNTMYAGQNSILNPAMGKTQVICEEKPIRIRTDLLMET